MTRAVDPDRVRAFGSDVDFGKTATDYARHRAGFPDRFFADLAGALALGPGMAAIDLGTGSGTVARGLARMGLVVAGLDPAPALLAEAAWLASAEGLDIGWIVGTAEALPLADASVDLVTAGQCWHWFDRPRAAAEAWRVLRPGGAVVIAHFDWLPLAGNVVARTEAMILAANPTWPLAGGNGLYPDWLADCAGAGFKAIETHSFDLEQPYSHADWRGRIRASAGVRASLDESAVARFDAALAAMLAREHPAEPMALPHRCWWVTARKPA